MVSVHSAEENEFLRRLIFIHYDSHKWVWLSRARNYNRTHGYLWLDSTLFDYTNWVGPEVDCSVCCEISLMTSGHWFASNCNSWTFAQVCQKMLPSSDMDAESSLRSLDGNFYLSQFNPNKKVKEDDKNDPKMSELIEWLSYEVEGVRNDIVKLDNRTRASASLEHILYERDSYLLTLLSLTVSLLMLILFAVAVLYALLHKKLHHSSSSFVDCTY